MRIFSTSLAAIALSVVATTASAAPTVPADIQQANIFHAFNWKFNDIRTELANIAAAGYGAIQVSPVQGNCASGAEWYYAYLPNDLKFIANGNGSRAQLKNLCAEAGEYGIKIIVDVVSNHINPKVGYRDAWWDEAGRLRDEGNVNYSNRHSITHGNLGDYKDVNSESAEVQERAKAFLEDLASIGVKGIRWDAAKHIALPSEDCAFWAKMAEVEGLYFYGEVLDNPGTSSDSQWKVMREYLDYMSVTDNGMANKARLQFQSAKMPSVSSYLAASKEDGGIGLPENKMIYWGESHDEFANQGGATKFMAQQVIDRVYMLLGCRKDAAAVYFSRPTKTAYADIKMGVKGSTDGLTNEAIKAVNNFRINTQGVAQSEQITFGANGYYINARKDVGAFVLLPSMAAKDIAMVNPGDAIPDGTYKDVIAGGDFTVADGVIRGHVGATGAACFYVKDPAGVAEIANDADAPVEFYTISGVKVEKPESGIYIKVQGSKRTKIVL